MLGVPILGALRPPFCGVGVADQILDFLERFLNVRFELRTCCDDATAAEAVAGKDAEQGFMSRSSPPLSEFEQPRPSVDQ